ncbi:PTS lactose/cellobiose transporter subunit IIA [uncultured Clostridium sp.]|uniref:PTS lactose/cellobiose transporter subunit IIA n=1 Tax=uncultured Clostridium sp. TaxID=59620 RepID=UPI0025DF4E47|nr:PTS lactose/cellobiose transporter subunit IIA [uncultured Clostridium sp.]
MEEVILSIIMHSGEARSYSMEAIAFAKEGLFDKSKELIRMADEELGYAHSSETSLIQGEAANDQIDFSLLIVHAQDHLMTTMTFKDLAVELIEMNERVYKLEHK